jgi:leader peptidase (prepilin peptidase) / N-methyltransferase
MEVSFSEIMGILFLGIGSAMDIKRRKISIWLFIIFGIIGIGIQIWQNPDRISQLLICLLPGLILLGVSKGTREALGYGDSLAVLVLGIYVGLWETVEIVMGGLLLSAVWAGILMIFLKRGKQAEFPFLPFLLLGMAGKIIGG